MTPLKPSSSDGGGHHALEEREGAVLELHDDAAERGQGRLDLDQVEDDRLVGAEHRARGDAEEQGVADLAGGAGHGHAKGGLHEDSTVAGEGRSARRKSGAGRPRSGEARGQGGVDLADEAFGRRPSDARRR